MNLQIDSPENSRVPTITERETNEPNIARIYGNKARQNANEVPKAR